jgi:hypothetical protein
MRQGSAEAVQRSLATQKSAETAALLLRQPPQEREERRAEQSQRRGADDQQHVLEHVQGEGLHVVRANGR